MIIAIEGGDQAGKKTQSQLLVNKLNSTKLKTKLFSFPDYTTPIGKEILSYLEGKVKLNPKIKKAIDIINDEYRYVFLNKETFLAVNAKFKTNPENMVYCPEGMCQGYTKTNAYWKKFNHKWRT